MRKKKNTLQPAEPIQYPQKITYPEFLAQSNRYAVAYKMASINEDFKKLVKRLNNPYIDFNALSKAIFDLKERLGRHPNSSDIRKMNKRLDYAIFKFHGGWKNVKKRLVGFSENGTFHTPYKEFDKVAQELKEISIKIGHFPTNDRLRSMGRADLIHAIYKYHGGIGKFKEKILCEEKDTYIRISERGKLYTPYKDFNVLAKKLKDISREMGHFPTNECLKSMGRTDLIYAVYKYHGSLSEAREKILRGGENIPVKTTQKGEMARTPYKDFNCMAKELRDIARKTGSFPGYETLKELGRDDIIYAIYKYHGNMSKVRKKIKDVERDISLREKTATPHSECGKSTEFHECFKKAKKGDNNARNRIVEKNIKLVYMVAHKYHNRHKGIMDFDDLIQEGCLGLLRAAELFEPDRGFEFSTYACNYIKGYIENGIKKKNFPIDIPAYLLDEIAKLKAVREKLSFIAKDSDMVEISHILNWPEEKIERLLDIEKALRSFTSLDLTIGEEEEDNSLKDFLADDKAEIQEKVAQMFFFKQHFYKIFNQFRFPAKCWEALFLRNGFDGERSKTLKEAGHRLGLSKARIGQLVEKILSALEKCNELRELYDASLRMRSTW